MLTHSIRISVNRNHEACEAQRLISQSTEQPLVAEEQCVSSDKLLKVVIYKK